MADPHFASVVLLAINDNAPDGTTTFVDQSSYARTLTANGNAQYDTAQAPTGMTSSGLFDGTGDYISAADSADWDFGTGDFTVEFWIRFAAVPSAGAIAFLIGNYGSSTTGWFTQFRSDGSNRLAFGTSGDSPLPTFAWTPSQDTWYFVATTRSGSDLRSFIGGTQIGTTQTNSEDITGSTAILSIGGLGLFNAQYVNGWMASVRITKGVARYTADFTPPTLPFPTSAVDPPVAAFSGTPLSGQAPLNVTFTDQSTNTPTSWLWDFGDGQTSTSQNPSHVFSAGTFTVKLTATNAAGSNQLTKTDYITVTAAPVTTTNRPSGVRKKVIKLSDANREDVGTFLKSQLKLKHLPPEVEVDTSAQDAEKERKRVAREARRERERARKLERDAERFERERKATELNAAEEIRIQNDNMRLLLMLAAA